MFFADAGGGDLCVAAAIVLGALWCGAALTQSHPGLRSGGLVFGLVAFVIVIASRYAASPPAASAGVVALIAQGLAVAALAIGLGWCFAVPAAALYATFVTPVVRSIADSRRRAADRRQSALLAEQQRAEESRRRRDFEAQAPERERQRLAREEALRSENESRLRRDQARARCELAYSLYAPEIGKRYSKDDFQAFAGKYLGDNHSPEYVEERITQLLDILKQHLHRAEPLRRFASLEELAAWFAMQKRQIDAVTDERMRRTLTAQLTERYADMTNRFLEEN